MFVELAGITSGDVPGTLDQCSMRDHHFGASRPSMHSAPTTMHDWDLFGMAVNMTKTP